MERMKRTFENFLSNKIVNLSDSAKTQYRFIPIEYLENSANQSIVLALMR